MFLAMQTLDSCKHIKIELLAWQTLKSRHTLPADRQTDSQTRRMRNAHEANLKLAFFARFGGYFFYFLLLCVTSLTFCYFFPAFGTFFLPLYRFMTAAGAIRLRTRNENSTVIFEGQN